MSTSVGYYALKPKSESTSLRYCYKICFDSIIFHFQKMQLPANYKTLQVLLGTTGAGLLGGCSAITRAVWWLLLTETNSKPI